MNRFKSLSHPLWFWTVSWFHAVSEGDYVSTSINRKWLWRIVSHDPIYTPKIDDLNVHFVPVTRYHYLVSNLRLTNTYLPCEQDFTNCNQFCTMWKNNNMWTYFHNEFFPMYQSNSMQSTLFLLVTDEDLKAYWTIGPNKKGEKKESPFSHFIEKILSKWWYSWGV